MIPLFPLLRNLTELLEEYADDPDFKGSIDCDEWYVLESDVSDCPDSTEDWDDFGGLANLDDWGEYIEKVEEFGEAFVLRHNDWSGHDDLDNYEGCWSSEEEFVQNLVEDCYNIDLPSFVSVDWEHTARDVMMDYSSYEGDEGYHIFRE